ncbi:MAG: PfkB family carbohydrate kinase [Pseudomonadota bacterium]
MAKLWFLGEALIDFVPAASEAGDAFAPRCGGSPYNAAKAAALAGADVGFLGAISTDMFGDRLAADIAASGVDAGHIPRVPEPTTLAFVELVGGEARYAFFNTGTATATMRPDPAAFPGAPGDVLSLGSISLIDAPGAGNLTAYAETLSHRATLSLDPNARPGMTPDAEAWRARIRTLADLSGILKLSEEDLAFLAPGLAPRDFAEAQIARGTGLVTVTHGAAGAEAFVAAGRVFRDAHKVEVVDTVGAGDTVTGYLLATLAAQGLTGRAALAAVDLDTVGDALDHALAASALTCTVVGCAPPTLVEVAAFRAA